MTDPADHLSDIAPVRRETVQARIHEQLRGMLMVGRFRPGQALKINDLADAFGTSAQPIRESIRQLVAERALEATINRSARVPLLTPEALDDLRRARIALEEIAAGMAAERATEADIDALETIVAEEAAADEGHNYEISMQHNLNFHFALYRLSGSSVLPPIIEGLWLQIGPNIRRAAEVFDASGGRGAEYHVRAIAALRARDADAVRRAIAEDINRFFALIRG